MQLLGVDTQLNGIFSPSFSCCTSPGDFLALRIPLLCLLARKLRLLIAYPAVYFLLCTPRSSGKRNERREEKQWDFLPYSWRRILNVCFMGTAIISALWKSYYHCCHHGFALGLEEESGKQQNEQQHHQREFTCSLWLAGAPGTKQRGFHWKLFLFAPGMLFWVWSYKGTISLIVLLVSQSAS